ncbi:coiled-coil domain-containing protein 158 [Cygnus atratus]|uniref:coiled-coil domain-containing protein 158 n=1 Tax=Cygnus atratus TaxID=8868 RepID=UPI0015D5EF56|nr:coiled-coil domain-containing protein 158 [Cygnus atratus]
MSHCLQPNAIDRQRESQSQESVKIQLKTTTEEMEAANHLQEEILREADSQNEHRKKMVHSHEEVLLELCGILMYYEDSTGKKLHEHGNITSLHIHKVSTAFLDILRDLDSELSYLKEKVVLVEEELESLKKDSKTQKELLLQQHQSRYLIEQLINEHEQEVAALTAKAKSAHSYAKSIQSQMENVQEQTRKQNSVHAHQVSHLGSIVSQLCSELHESRRLYEDKMEDLEKQLHLAHSEVAKVQNERDRYNQECGNLNDRIHQLLTELHGKEVELSLEKEQNKRFWDRNTDNSMTVDNLRTELDEKNMELQLIKNMVKEMRIERQGQMEQQLNALQKKIETIVRISSLTFQLESTKERLGKVKEDLRAKQMDLETAERTVSNLTACLKEKEMALEVTNKEIKKLHSHVGSKMQELEHLKNKEGRLHDVQSEGETLKLQVVEKERIIEILQKQIDTMIQVVDQQYQTAGAMEVEKSQLLKEIGDWKLQVQEHKIAKEEEEVRIHKLEATLSKLELEKVKLVNTCTERLHAINDMKLEKDELMSKLKAIRIELAGLAEGFEDLKRDCQDKVKEMENNANRLKMQLRSSQAQLEQTRKALKTVEGSDGHAMKVAVGMQREVTAKRGQIDALQSKIKLLEEAMANAAKETHYLREENSKLSQELSCIATGNNKIAGQLEILRSQEKCLKEKLSKMETALDKMLSKLSILKEEPLQDLKRTPQELTSSDDNISSVDLGKNDSDGGKTSPLATIRNTVDPLCLRTADLQSQGTTQPFTSPEGASIFSAAPRYTSRPKKVCPAKRCRERSPVHLLLTAPPDDLAAGPSTSPEHRPSVRKSDSPDVAATVPWITSQSLETSENTSKKLQNKMESLQNQVETLQRKSQAMSSMIRTQETKTEKAKEKEKLSK